MENVVRDELRVTEDTLRQLTESPRLHLLQYDAEMMDRAVEFGFSMPEINPYDQAVLASVIVGSVRLHRAGEREMFFCELDSDLQPWDRNGVRLERLAALYDAANVWVCGDYLLPSPPVPNDWHNRPR